MHNSDLEGTQPSSSDEQWYERGGAGLYEATRPSRAPRWANAAVGLLALLVFGGIAVTLVTINPSFASGKAMGTADQIGQKGAAGEAPAIAPGSPAAEGQKVIVARGCGGCHTIPGIPGASGQVGPNLAGVASRPKIAGGAVPNTGPEDLAKWVMDPPAQKPGTAMPKLGLSQDEANNVAAYLETLK